MQWTAGRTATISAPMANRLFLTLLALLTGLAAQLTPAQARLCPQQTAAVAISPAVVARAPAGPVELARLPEAGWRHARRVASADGAQVPQAWRAPSVRIRIDRARD
jgi:hypothetical protein